MRQKFHEYFRLNDSSSFIVIESNFPTLTTFCRDKRKLTDKNKYRAWQQLRTQQLRTQQLQAQQP